MMCNGYSGISSINIYLFRIVQVKGRCKISNLEFRVVNTVYGILFLLI